VLVLLLLSMLVPQAVVATDLTPEQIGAIGEIFAPWDRDDSPGAAVGVVRGGELVWSDAFGLANLDYGVELTPDSPFYIASSSKQFTAASIALLSLDGVVPLDADVRRWLPELPESTPAITVRHLVHHTSGLRDYLSLMGLAGASFEAPFDNDDALEIVARQQRHNFAPGERYLYSNSGYALLISILERAAGRSSQAFGEERIFGPLGMARTHWGSDPARVLPGRVTSYALRDEGGGGEDDGDEGAAAASEPRAYRRFVQSFAAHGDGNLWTSVRDLARWDRNFYTGEVGGEAFLELIHTRGQLADGSELAYAFGLSFGEHRGRTTVAHQGGMLGYRTEFLRLPDEELTVIVLCNLASMRPGELAREVVDVLLGESGGPPPEMESRIFIPPEVLESYVGEYYDGERASLVEVKLEEGRLQLVGFGEPVPLYQRSMSTFANRQRGLELRFEGDGSVAASALVVRASSPPESRLARLERVRLAADDLADYAGSYWSEELLVSWQLSVVGDELHIERDEPSLLEPLDRDRFAGPGAHLAFLRADGGEVVGFEVSTGRANGVAFVRR
jgi:CubicO group peptidase (beta-lactamase class C family)